MRSVDGLPIDVRFQSVSGSVFLPRFDTFPHPLRHPLRLEVPKAPLVT